MTEELPDNERCYKGYVLNPCPSQLANGQWVPKVNLGKSEGDTYTEQEIFAKEDIAFSDKAEAVQVSISLGIQVVDGRVGGSLDSPE